MDDNETHFSDHFAIYKNIESLCSTPETVIRQIDLKKRERWSTTLYQVGKKSQEMHT